MPPRVAILGTGWGSRVQVPVFRRAGLEIASVWSPTRAHAQRAARRWQVERAEADALTAIGRPDVDLVSIVTPPDTHEQLTLAALEAGKHVLCEKPTALDAVQAERMAAAAERHPGQLAILDHELRFDPLRRRLRDLVREGYVGRPLDLEACFLGGGRLGSSWKWDWWSRAESGGGILGAAGSHLVDLLHWIFERPTRRVWARLATVFGERADVEGRLRAVTADEIATVRLELADGPGAVLRLSSVSAGPRVHRVRVDGSEGSLLLEGGRLTGFRDGVEEDLGVAPGVELAPLRSDEWTVGTYYLAGAIRSALAASPARQPLDAADLRAGLGVQRVLDAARAADGTGCWVDLA